MWALILDPKLIFSYVYVAVCELNICVGSSSKDYRLLLSLVTCNLCNDVLNFEVAWYFILYVDYLHF